MAIVAYRTDIDVTDYAAIRDDAGSRGLAGVAALANFAGKSDVAPMCRCTADIVTRFVTRIRTVTVGYAEL